MTEDGEIGSTEFRRVMDALASAPEGWSGPAGDDFAALMHRVFARKMAGLNRDSRSGALLLVDASDAVSEAVLVVDGARPAVLVA